MNNVQTPRTTPGWKAVAFSILVLVLVLGLLFAKSFQENEVVFSNDGPLGVVKSQALSLPAAFKGYWVDLHWLGLNGTHATAGVTYALLWLLDPMGYAKFYPPISLLLLGICAWTFFRTLGLSTGLCTVAALAAALNSNFFSNTCWGLGTRAITLAAVFLALALLQARRVGHPWLNAALAGLAVGMGVVEGSDNGVIFSLFVAAFVVVQSFVQGGSPAQGVKRSLRLVLVAGFAVFIAMQVLISLFNLAAAGAVSAQADPERKAQKWAFATQWSLPPDETMRVLIPGLYGYRMDSPDGANYRGRVGEAPGSPQPGSRFSGAGEYAGVLVVLVALWSLAASLYGTGGVFTTPERRLIWFWGASFLVALLLSWGRFAPFYQVVYQLPYFSSIRNPMKFMHAGHMALMILFGYGLLGLSRKYLESTAPKGSVSARLAAWWSKAQPFEKRWTAGMIAVLGLSCLAFLTYASERGGLVKQLMAAGFPDAGMATRIAQFSVGEVGKFVGFLFLSAGALLLVMGGVFAGGRARWAAVLLGLILTVDLARANTPWIVYWDYRHKYATNPILDILREKPYEARVVAPPFLFDPRAAAAGGRLTAYFPQLYGIEWVQHHFQYYNIQSIDVAQDPRPPADKQAYMQAMHEIGRYWELTNTRYVLGMTAFLDALNTQADKGRNRFRVRATFELAPKPGETPSKLEDLTAVQVENGPLALFEYTAALPRAKLYAQWQVQTNGDEALKTLTDPAFDPAATVVVSEAIGAPVAQATNAAAGTVEFARYSPQRIALRANAATSSVLLLNDRFDPDWRVTVDGQAARLLRCNFIMRGVQLPTGQHTVVFHFEPSLKGLKISLAAMGVGVLLCALLFFVRQPEDLPPENAGGQAKQPAARDV